MNTWLIEWGQMGRALVEADDGSSAFDKGNVWLEKYLPMCGVRDARRLNEKEIVMELGRGTRVIES